MMRNDERRWAPLDNFTDVLANPIERVEASPFDLGWHHHDLDAIRFAHRAAGRRPFGRTEEPEPVARPIRRMSRAPQSGMFRESRS
ncbi:MAG: hypothetical protein KF894_08980 [Labilithrix sp.]|nr:hypothetical protein [Labilithrix sp.]